MFNRSQRGIWMNEAAYPGSAINTIGFRMYFPSLDARRVSGAAEAALKDVDTLKLTLDAGSLQLCPGFDAPECPVLEKISFDAAQAEWSGLSEKAMGGALCRFTVRDVYEGGCFLTALFHHIIVDGRAMCLIAQRIADAVNGKPLSPVPLSLKEDAEIPSDPFWVEYFDEVNSEPSILSGTAEGIKRTWYRKALSKELTNAIDSFAKKHSITPASVFSGALSVYLSGAARTRDAVFLMPRMDRATPGELNAIDCRTQVVPVRVRVDRAQSFDKLCQTALSQGRLASAHKAYGIDRIFADLRNAGIFSGIPSEYVLNFYSTGLESETPCEMQMSMDGAMHNHLTLNITRFGESYEILYDARNGIYDETRTNWLHDALTGILEKGISSDAPVGGFELVGAGEKARLEEVFGVSYPIDPNATIPSLFREAVRRYSTRPALFAGENSYTYSELDKASNRIARALMQRGIGGGDFVMFKLRRDHRLLPAMLGILKSGAAFIPIDPAYPADRIAYIQENSGAAALIEDRSMMAEETAACSILDIDELLAYPVNTDPFTEIPQEQPAYSIYTSGTTGRPKGVILSHKGIVNITNPDNNPFNREICRCGRGMVATGSVCFDISLFEFFVPLLNGMFIEFAPEKAMADASALAELIDRHGANLFHCTPSRIAAYLRNARFSKALGSVYGILSAGEALPGSLVDTLDREYGVRVFNGYGPTETTIGATVSEAGDNKTIGAPIGNMGVLVLDDEGRQVPMGAIGELCVYGAGVGIGYKNLPEMTQARFVERCGRRVYRTGDLGRVQDDNRILYYGRNDSQVKIRGLRIELPEIESSILAFPGIAGACVQVRSLQGSEHLVGFYSAREGSGVNQEELLNHLKGRLTFYMVPDILKELDFIPQTPGGKTDQRAVSKIEVKYVRSYRAPENPFQQAICEAMQATLNQEKVSVDDNFFTIGGDSLHTAELINEIENRLPGVNLEFEDIMKYPIPEQLAQFLYRGAAAKPKQDNPLAELDYTGVDDRVKYNTGRISADELKTHRLGTVLLTGATGFLGTHVLVELIRRRDICDKIYCLVRATKRQSSERRLRSTLFYYEETDYDEEIGTRVFAVNGDITGDTLSNELDGVKIDTVINCAANVSHFAYDDKLMRVNTDAVSKLIAFCERQNAEFVQVSTISVAGMLPVSEEQASVFTESSFFMGQQIRSQYIISKYMAEYAALRSKVPVKIMRVGNLQGRVSDGEFQINSKTNAFTRRIASYVRMGAVPRSLYNASVNFSPVDDVARMVVALASTEPKYTAFHVYPLREVTFRAMFDKLASLGHPVRIMPDNEFEAEIEKLRATKDGLKLLEGILLERPDENFRDTPISAVFTARLLDAMGQYWNDVTEVYLDRYFRALEGLNMFDGMEE